MMSNCSKQSFYEAAIANMSRTVELSAMNYDVEVGYKCIFGSIWSPRILQRSFLLLMFPSRSYLFLFSILVLIGGVGGERLEGNTGKLRVVLRAC